MRGKFTVTSAVRTWKTINAGKANERREATLTVTTDDGLEPIVFGGNRATLAYVIVVDVPERTWVAKNPNEVRGIAAGDTVVDPGLTFIDGCRSKPAGSVRGCPVTNIAVTEAE